MSLNPPIVKIPSRIWNNIIKTAKEFSGEYGCEKAFGLFAKRRRGKKVPEGFLANHYDVIDFKEIELEHISPGVYTYKNQKKRGFYPKDGLRYIGAVEIRKDLKIDPMDAYWIGREQTDIMIYINQNLKDKVYWVNHGTGEILKTKFEIIR